MFPITLMPSMSCNQGQTSSMGFETARKKLCLLTQFVQFQLSIYLFRGADVFLMKLSASSLRSMSILQGLMNLVDPKILPSGSGRRSIITEHEEIFF